MKVLLLDGYNLLHRARYGFTSGSYSVIFNFFRALRPLVEKFSPDKVYFVLEGYPKERYELLPSYKENRKKGMTPEKEKSYKDFKRQKATACEIILNFPFETVYHPDYECDDVIANLVINYHPDDECIIISNDTDYIQMYGKHKNCSIWSPVKKEYLLPTEYNYVYWKALVGDTADNIRGVPRVGKKTAEKILFGDLKSWKKANPEKAKIFERNVKLISFADLSDRMDEIIIQSKEPDFSRVRDKFIEMEFKFAQVDKSWHKYATTFDSLYED